MDNKKYLKIVELDPPVSADAERFLAAARELKDAGVDMVTVSDSPSARPRMDSCLLACRVRREVSIETLPHLTCRDRNSIAMKALLMGIYSEGIRNILIVTGDPFGEEQRQTTYYKSVFEHNSRTMTRGVYRLVGNELPGAFNIFGALNVNARNFSHELSKAEDKVRVGMCGFLTQPIFSEKAIANLEKAKAELGVPVYGGIMPIVSEKNAIFMNENVPGITVPKSIVEKYHEKSKEECAQLAVEISRRTADAIRPHSDGIYVVTPFYRTEIVKKILE
ncbi:MAG: methylenetetrahydrofolate reductase [Lachnospiraceae bacterium]|nr:methylenetetrahydrofolate reductase [Lachnospiraceae bacterium]